MGDRENTGHSAILKPLGLITLLTVLFIILFLHINQDWMNLLSKRVEDQHRQSLIQIVTLARNAVEPFIQKIRSGSLSRQEALENIRAMVRKMTYTDSYGNNYVFMSAYDGTMLVQPFEPSKEMTNQWNFQDTHGFFIIRELVKAAREHPEGSFVSYYYYLPAVHTTQEKLAYVVGLPELECYIGTGMYMQHSFQEQMNILKKVKYGSLFLVLAVLLPISAAVIIILKRNRSLQNEVSIRRRTEEALRASESLLSGLSNNLPDGMLYQIKSGTDGRDKTFTYISPGAEKLHGLKPEEIQKNPSLLYKQIEESHRQFMLEAEARAMKLRTRFDVDIPFSLPNGKKRWSRITSSPRMQPDGNVLWDGIEIDITEQKRAENDLRASEEKFALAFQACPSIMSLSTLEKGRMIDVNESFLQKLGYKRDEVVGHTSEDLRLWVNPSQRAEVVRELTASGKMSSFEFQYRDKSGQIHWGINTPAIIRIMGVPCILFQILDITERKRLEGQLLQAQKMEAVGHLAGGVAHDFNNLIQVILGYVELMLLEMEPGAPHYKNLGEIKRAGERAALLTRQLLAFSRKQVLQLTSLNVNHVVKELLQMLKRLISEHIELIFLPCKFPENVRADRSQLEQVLMNLCVNARDAMPTGGQLLIETYNQEADEVFIQENTWARPGRYLCISVSDTGCGMSKETLSKIFDPFFTTKEKHKGTGLGLAMVYGIIRQHQGMVDVYSQVGKGTCFKIFLPADLPDNEGKSVIQEPAYDKGGTETILLAEDEEQIRNLACNVLTKAGYRILSATDGRQAQEIYQAHAGEISLLFLDMVMPKLGGAAVYETAKTLNPKIKCLFSSGYSPQGLLDNFIQKEGLHLLQKPYTRHELLKKIRLVLDALP